jgi:Flp pilus assembly protein TadD
MAKPQKNKGLSLEELREQNDYTPESIDFLGRTAEMQKIEEFRNSNKRILEIVGVPMIGKTKLTKEYCKLHKIEPKRIEFRQKPYTPFADLEEKLFGKGKFNDFSGIEKGTLLIIENFEQALHWTAQDDNLHQITAKGITDFLNKLAEKDCKLLIETRFQIRFDRDFQKYFVQTLQIQGIDAALFWDYYASKNFSAAQFEDLCQKFDQHTGLLALAYDDAQWLYENELHKAIYEPTATSRNLWKLLEVIIKKLSTAERQILAALTLWQSAIGKQELQSILQGYFTANFDKTLESLKKKLLVFSSIQDQQLAYALNPYLAEVFFAFMENSAEIREIKALPALQQKQLPEYDRIRQAHNKGEYKTFFAWIKDKRKAGKYEEVIAMLQSVYWEDPKPEVILNEIGVTYKWQKKYKEAKEVLQKACDLGNIQSFNELGIIYKQEGNFEEAKEVLQKALAINEKDVKTLNELGIIYKQEGNFEEAKKVLLKALAINGKDVKTLNELGIIYKQEGNFEEAKKVLQKALAINEKDVKTLNELGIIYKQEGNFEEAKKVLLKACELGNIQSFNELGIIYKQEGNFEEAKKVLQKACELGNIQSFNELGIIYKQEGNFEEAKKVLQKALNTEPNNVRVLNELAIVYKEAGDFAKALETVEKGLKIEPNNKYLPNVKKSILQAQKAHQSMQPSIQKAIAALQNANYAGYFEEMDKVVPVSLQNKFAELRMQFISGDTTWKFYQQLEEFAKVVDKGLSEKISQDNNQNTNNNHSNSTKMNRTEKEIQGLEKVLDLLIEKKNYFREQLVNASDAEVKFSLQQKLKELEKEIAQYKAEADKIAKEVVSRNNSTVSGKGNFVFQGIENATINVSVVNNLTEKFEKLDKEVKELQVEKTTILMLTANPLKATKLNLDKEHSKIAEKLQSHQNKFSLILEKAINKNEFKEKTETHRPTILHFAGHGEKGEKVTAELQALGIEETEGGIILQNDDKNGYDTLSTEMIDVLFEYFKDEKIDLQLVVLNACYSETQAQVIAKYVPYVIGTTKAIADTCAIAFSTGLYFRLSTQFEVEQAFKSGRTAAVLEKANKSDFVLFVNGQKQNI